jgi:hypothetical protein
MIRTIRVYPRTKGVFFLDSNTRLLIVMGVALAGYFAVIRLALWRFLLPPARRLLIGLAVLGSVWAACSIITDDDKTFWGWLFSDSAEYTASAMLSSLLLLLIALAALINAFRPAIAFGRRLPWLIPAAFFFFLSLDEYYSYHESVETWRTIYAGCGLLLILASVILAGIERDFRIPLFVMLGAGMIGFGGVALDALANEARVSVGSYDLDWFYCHHSRFYGIVCQDFGVLEEWLELGGESLILAGFVSFAHKSHAPARWALTRRSLAGAAIAWALWMIGSMWIIPTIQARVMADPVRVEYQGGALRLARYHLSQNTTRPGDTVDVTLYFEARTFIHENYYLSVHLLSHPEVESLAQDDTQLGEWEYPTSAWLPYLAVRHDLHLKLPADLPAPASYWITVRVWEGPDLEHYTSASQKITITRADRQQIAPDTVILSALPVVGDPPASAPARAADYRFDNGLRLYGYDLPGHAEIGQAVTLHFWWQTRRDMRADLTQYIHLDDENSDGLFVFDQTGLGDSFPFADWPDGLDVLDTWTITLPDEIPPGTYRVYTGIYDTLTITRIPVKDGSGQTVRDDSIDLGIIEIK